jgi:hypothetical protein
MHRLGYLLGLATAAVLLVGLDRIGTSDDAGQVSLLVLLAASALLGFAAPRLAWLAGLVIGAALAAANPGDALLLILIVPATVAAYLGAGTAWLIRR